MSHYLSQWLVHFRFCSFALLQLRRFKQSKKFGYRFASLSSIPFVGWLLLLMYRLSRHSCLISFFAVRKTYVHGAWHCFVGFQCLRLAAYCSLLVGSVPSSVFFWRSCIPCPDLLDTGLCSENVGTSSQLIIRELSLSFVSVLSTGLRILLAYSREAPHRYVLFILCCCSDCSQCAPSFFVAS